MGFGLMAAVANKFIGFGRKLGRNFGYRMAVDQSGHTLQAHMVNPNAGDRAWDPDMFRHGNLFISGYANPVKLSIDYEPELEEPSTVDVKESDVVETDGGEEAHKAVISSPRYREYMRQDLIAQLLNPEEQWKKLMYAILAVIGLSIMNTALAASAAGVL